MKKILFIIVIIIISFCPISYIPNITSIFEDSIIILIGIAFFLSILNKFIINKSKTPRILVFLIWMIIIAGIEFLIFHAFILNYTKSDLISIIVAFACIYVGYSNNFDIHQIRVIFTCFCIATLVMSYLSIRVYVGDFDVNVADYLVDRKNQVGQLLSQCSIISFIMFFYGSKTRRLIMALILFLSLYFLLIIKCKTAIITSVFVITYLAFLFSSKKKRMLVLSIIIILLVTLFVFYDDVYVKIIDVIGLSGKETIEEITTGRVSRNMMAIEYLKNNLFLGELNNYSNIPLIHNWVLLRLVRYGIFSFPFLLYYIYLLLYVIKDIISVRQWIIQNVGSLLFIVPYITSLVEPNVPFTSCSLLVYIMFGQTISNKKISTI